MPASRCCSLPSLRPTGGERVAAGLPHSPSTVREARPASDPLPVAFASGTTRFTAATSARAGLYRLASTGRGRCSIKSCRGGAFQPKSCVPSTSATRGAGRVGAATNNTSCAELDATRAESQRSFPFSRRPQTVPNRNEHTHTRHQPQSFQFKRDATTQQRNNATPSFNERTHQSWLGFTAAPSTTLSRKNIHTWSDDDARGSQFAVPKPSSPTNPPSVRHSINQSITHSLNQSINQSHHSLTRSLHPRKERTNERTNERMIDQTNERTIN